MRKYILGFFAVGTLLCGSGALAQTGNQKESGGLMNDSRQSSRWETHSTYARTEQSPDEAAARRSASYEPASGHMAGEDSYDDFTGPYIGGDIGYTIGSAEINNPAGPDGDVGLDGWEGGVFAGYGMTHDFGWLGGYGGVEAGYEWSGLDGRLGNAGFEKNGAWVLSFRPGLTMWSDTLAYGIVGYKRAEFENAAGDDENLDGLVLGAGTEFDTHSPLKGRIEYTYTNYEDAELDGVDFDEHENAIKVGALLRF